MAFWPRKERKEQCDHRSRQTGVTWPQIRECWEPTEAGSGKDWIVFDSLQSQGQPCQHFDFGSMKVTLDFCITASVFIVLSHKACTNLWQWSLETSTVRSCWQISYECNALLTFCGRRSRYPCAVWVSGCIILFIHSQTEWCVGA